MATFPFDRTPHRPADWRFEVYTDGSTPFETIALTNLCVLCETHLPERFEIEVVDAGRSGGRARAAGVGVFPCVVRRSPGPVVMTGAFRDLDRLSRDLGIRPEPARARA